MLCLLPLIVLPLAALIARPWLPAWAFMWAMAGAIYFGCKWLTYCRVHRTRPTSRAELLRATGYLFAWPGMDAVEFLSDAPNGGPPDRLEWSFAGLKTCFGVALIWVLARIALPEHPLAAGWIAMAGMIFVLHFGTFHLLSLGWQAAGVNAPPLMRNPAGAASLGDFWARRWNTAFHELASKFTFRPLQRVAGATAATLGVFLASGLIHELVITVPARGGYGLPTAYFMLQGLAVAGERTRSGRRFGLGRGWRGRLFTIVVAAGPAFWLFPPPFVHNVVLPMLAAIGAA